MGTWQLQQAKARLSEVIEYAKSDGPQVITQRGVKSAVIIPFDVWESTRRSRTESLFDILRTGPQDDLSLPARDSWKMRKQVEL